MGNLGNLLQLLAILAGVGAIVFYFSAFQAKDSKASEQYDRFANYFMLSQAGLVTLASIILTYALATGYFKMEYVAQYTSAKLPMIYKLSGFWAGQAGSLLFWAWLAVIFGAIEVFRLKKSSVKYRSGVFLTVALTSTFFLILTSFVTNPFTELDFFPQDGMGMNPLLQNPGMIYHPPALYLGFVGFTIPLGHALGAILTKDGSSLWLKLSRKWTLFTWVFLTIGIVLGGQWAYVELGWGGYWAWDPVENASLLPWFTATALLHSSVMYEHRGKMKVWTFIMLLLSYELCIFGTFLTRSGVLDSVHSFGKSALGPFFIVFIIVSSAIFLAAFFKNFSLYKDTDETEFSFFSREGLFFLTNWMFTGLMVVVLVGTIMPILSGFFSADKITVGIPYYNKVSTPFFMIILIFSGIAPLLPYGKMATDKMLKKLMTPFIVMIIVMAVTYAMGNKLIIPLILTGFTTFSLVTITLKIIESVRKNGTGVLLKNKRFYGGLIIHFGVVLMAYGIIASSFYNTQMEKVVQPGETFKFGKYDMKVGEVTFRDGRNYVAALAPVTVMQDGKKIVTLAPQRRFYDKNDEAFAEVALQSSLKGDLYFILASYSKPENYVGIQVIFQPMIMWIWIGCAFMVLGGVYGMFHREPNG